MTATPTYKYYLQKGNQFITAANVFTAPSMGHKSALSFDSEDAALNKAEELGLHLDDINVIKKKVRQRSQQLPG